MFLSIEQRSLDSRANTFFPGKNIALQSGDSKAKAIGAEEYRAPHLLKINHCYKADRRQGQGD